MSGFRILLALLLAHALGADVAHAESADGASAASIASSIDRQDGPPDAVVAGRGGATLTLSSNESVVVEGEIIGIQLTATLDQALGDTVNVTLGYAGTATFGADYTAGTTITIPAGQLTGTRTFFTNDDTAIEPDETIIVSLLTAGPNVTIGTPDSVTVTIEDDDLTGVVSLGVSETLVTEGEIISIELTATLDQPVNNTTSITLGYSGTATYGADYSAGTTITIPAGQLSGTRSFFTNDDVTIEPDETIIVSLLTAGPNVTIGTPDSVTVTIEDDDLAGVVTLSASETVVTEGEIIGIQLTATLDQPVNNTTSITLGYSGTATYGADYSAGTTITIPAGQLSGTRTFFTNDDATIEPDETIIVSLLTAGPNVTIGTPDAVTVTIEDDDQPATVTLSVSESVVTEGAVVGIELTATLDQPVNNTTSITLGYSGTATYGADYTAGTTMTIPAGQLTGTRTFFTNDDTAIEPDETIIVSLLTAGPNVDIGTPDSVTVTIEDEDLAGVVTLSASETVVTEGEIIGIQLTATLDQPVNNTTSITLGYSGTATPGSDYTAGTTITIPAGQLTGTRTFFTNDDSLEEPTETIIVTILSAQPNVTIGTPDSVTIEILDDDSDPIADLAVDISSSGQVRFGGFVYWSILVDNLGPNEAIAAHVVNDFPANVSGVVWICSSSDGGLCPGSGSGNIDTLVDLPSGSAVEFTACAIAEVFEDDGIVTNSATVTAAPDTVDPNPSNNSDTLTIENIYLFADGFETAGPEAICASLLMP